MRMNSAMFGFTRPLILRKDLYMQAPRLQPTTRAPAHWEVTVGFDVA